MKTITKYVDYEKMSDINDIFNVEGKDEIWIDLKKIKKYPKIRDYISLFEINALIDKFIDFIVFKLEN